MLTSTSRNQLGEEQKLKITSEQVSSHLNQRSLSKHMYNSRPCLVFLFQLFRMLCAILYVCVELSLRIRVTVQKFTVCTGQCDTMSQTTLELACHQISK